MNYTLIFSIVHIWTLVQIYLTLNFNNYTLIRAEIKLISKYFLGAYNLTCSSCKYKCIVDPISQI